MKIEVGCLMPLLHSTTKLFEPGVYPVQLAVQIPSIVPRSTFRCLAVCGDVRLAGMCASATVAEPFCANDNEAPVGRFLVTATKLPHTAVEKAFRDKAGQAVHY